MFLSCTISAYPKFISYPRLPERNKVRIQNSNLYCYSNFIYFIRYLVYLLTSIFHCLKASRIKFMTDMNLRIQTN